MRTMSVINSRASTPRSGTLRLHNDLSFDSNIITGSYNMTTGSRTLDRSFTGSFDRPTYQRYGRSSSCERPAFDRSCPGSFDRHRNDDSDFFHPSPPLRSSLRTFQSRSDAEPDTVASAFSRKSRDVESNSRSEFVLIPATHAQETCARNLCKSSCTRSLHVCRSVLYKFFLVQVSCTQLNTIQHSRTETVA